MAEQVIKKEEDKKNKKLIIIIIVVAIVIIAALVGVIIAILNNSDEPEKLPEGLDNGIQYQPGVIGLNQNDLQDAFDKAVEKVKDGYVTLEFDNKADSDNGEDFTCYLGNSLENTYDVFFSIYLDATFTDRVLLTGLVPPGSGIDHFKSEYILDPGTYKAVLVLTQVGDDHATIHSQTNVEITLNVKG